MDYNTNTVNSLKNINHYNIDMYIYTIKIQEKDFDTLLYKDTKSPYFPEDHVKLFVSSEEPDVILKQHVEIYKTENIYIYHTQDTVLLDNFYKIISCFIRHKDIPLLYYYPFVNISDIFDKFSNIFTIISKDKCLTEEEYTQHKLFPDLDNIIKQYIRLINDNSVFLYNDYNPYYEQVKDYIKNNKEYKYLSHNIKIIITKISSPVYPEWKKEIINIHNSYLYVNSHKFNTIFKDIDDIDRNIEITYKDIKGEKFSIITDTNFLIRGYFGELEVIDDIDDIIDRKSFLYTSYFLKFICKNIKHKKVNVGIVYDKFIEYLTEIDPCFIKNINPKIFSSILKKNNIETKKTNKGVMCLDLTV
jgi:hypothetical protein